MAAEATRKPIPISSYSMDLSLGFVTLTDLASPHFMLLVVTYVIKPNLTGSRKRE